MESHSDSQFVELAELCRTDVLVVRRALRRLQGATPSELDVLEEGFRSGARKLLGLIAALPEPGL